MDNNNFNDMGNGFESSYTNQSNMNGYNEQPFVSPTYNGTIDPPRPYAMEQPVSVSEWIITILITMIPCVGIIMMFIWAFNANEKTSKSNFFKAELIMVAAMLVLGGIYGALTR